MEEFCKQRELFLKQYEDTKKYLKNYMNELHKYNTSENGNDFSRLKEIMQICLHNLGERNAIFNLLEHKSEHTQKIKELDRNFYLTVCETLRLIETLLKDKKDDKLAEIKFYFEILKNQYETREFFSWLKGIGNFIMQHTSLLVIIPIFIGVMILAKYFYFDIEYLPNLNRDSALYYIVAAAGLGVIMAPIFCLFILSPFYLIKELFKNVVEPKKHIYMIHILLLLLPTMVFVLLLSLELFEFISEGIESLVFWCLIICSFAPLLIFVCYYHRWFKYPKCFGVVISIVSSMIILGFYGIFLIYLIQGIGLEPAGFILFSLFFMLYGYILFLATPFVHIKFKIVFLVAIIIFCIVNIAFSPFIVKKLQVGNYTAEKLIFKQEAEEDIKSCKYEMGANNTLVLSNINIISSLGDYILFECEDKETSNMNNKIEHRDNKNKQDMKTKILQIRVPTYYLVGEIARPSSQDVKEALDSTLVSNEAISN